MTYTLMTSGGKDSTLALDRATRNGLVVDTLANLYDAASGRVRFHGVKRELIEQQALALGLNLLASPTTPEGFENDFLNLLRTLRQRGCTGVIFGNIHLADVRGWYEERVSAAGLEHIEPLWGDPPIELVHEVVERGYRALIVSVDLKQGAAGLFGRELDADLLTEISIGENFDPCGEHGEYHSLVFDGPMFRAPLAFRRGQAVERDGHRLLDLIPVG